ncbi:MAG TPA: ROK family protein [Chthonomonadales bacterium]|nr:ROK family protein [Chthonomonadales bacterium]
MILGVDIGGTKCAVALGAADGAIVARRSVQTPAEAGPQAVLDRLIEMGRDLVAESGVPAVDAIGISCGGPLDTTTGIVHSPPNLPGWEAVPVRSLFEEAWPGIRVVLENDANATAVAEWRWGAGRGTRHMAFLTMGTGIGGGLILDGRLYRGATDLAGEVGHQTILVNGPLCNCGKRGCLEALASGPAIARLARDSRAYGRGRRLLEAAGGRAEDITARHVVDLAREGDAFCSSVLAEAGTYMGIGLANLIQTINPERVVLGTIAVHAGDLVLEPIRAAVREYAWQRAADACSIVAAQLGDGAQDLAAIAVTLDT